MPEWSPDAKLFLSQFKDAHPGFYERLLASPPFRGDETILIGTTEAEIERLSPAGAYVSFVTFVATMYAKDLAGLPKAAIDQSSPTTTIAKLKALAAEMPKMTWRFEDLKSLDHAREVLENQIGKLNERTGYISPKGPKRPSIDLVEARRLLADGIPHGKVAKKFGVSRATLSKLMGPKGSE